MMNESPILISTPSGMEWLVGLALPAILGFVGFVVVWRTVRIYKNLRSKSNKKRK